MKIVLSMELDEKELTENISPKMEYTKEEIKEELTQMLFEVCEDWVIKGQVPDLEFEDE